MAKHLNTLGALIADDYTMSAHCTAQGCGHGAQLDLHALAEKLGADFVTVGDPNPLLPKLRCSRCGGRQLQLTLVPRSGYEKR